MDLSHRSSSYLRGQIQPLRLGLHTALTRSAPLGGRSRWLVWTPSLLACVAFRGLIHRSSGYKSTLGAPNDVSAFADGQPTSLLPPRYATSGGLTLTLQTGLDAHTEVGCPSAALPGCGASPPKADRLAGASLGCRDVCIARSIWTIQSAHPSTSAPLVLCFAQDGRLNAYHRKRRSVLLSHCRIWHICHLFHNCHKWSDWTE